MRPLVRPSIAGSACAALMLCAAVAVAQSQAAGPGPAAPVTPPQSAGERGLAAGDCRMAAEGFEQDARASRDPAVAYRAVEIAKACAHLPAAWRSAQRLVELDPENVEALRLAGTIALEMARHEDARRIFGDLLRKPDVEPERALRDILPPLAEVDLAPAAWQVFPRILDRSTLSPQVVSVLARMACNADDLKGCLGLIDEARTRDGGRDAATIRLAATAAAALDDADRALAEAQLVAQGDPEEHRFAVVETLVALDRSGEARAEIDRIAAEPDHAVEADRRLALLALADGDGAEAQRRFAGRMQRDQGAGEALFYLSLLAEREGRTDVALQGYQQLINAGAGLAPRSRAARLLVKRGDAAAAMRIFDGFLRSGRADFIDTEVARARALADGGMHAEAVQGIDLALQRHPDHPELRYQRAVELDAAGKTREAIKVFEALLAERPEDAAVQNALGYTLADRDRQLRRAERLIRSALAQRPDNAAFIDSLGWVLYRRGKLREAAPVLERSWRLSREGEIAAHYGEVLWKLGEQAQARAIWARALVTSPESKPLRATIERLTGEPPAPAAPVPSPPADARGTARR
jgi:tetratricopeptide (TPR) repeat protein